ncbi:MAG TPA: MFS transporter [Burkholderiales bacterium]|nr:MFS transporter [Burkholderiales bacterium]
MSQTRSAMIVTLAAAAFLMITMGVRQSFGLFISPLNSSTGLGIATISFALAIGQFTWGAIQPVAGALADRHGPGKVLVAGAMLLAAGMALTPFMSSSFGLIVSLGLLASIGSGAGSFSVLIGAASQRLPAEARGKAAGIVNAGGSMGQFVFAPLAQALISALGWMAALWSMAAMALAALPLVRAVAPRDAVSHTNPTAGDSPWKALGNAFKDNSYVLLNLGFFTCGFHIAFLVTHLPQEVNLCGLPPTVASWSLAIIGLANIAGSLTAGHATARFRSKYILAWMYGSRAVLIALYLAAPKTALTFYLFAAGLGATWLATVPPTASIVGKLFGVRFMATLFGMTLLSHQIGGFLGAWLGGIAYERAGSYQWMWYADMALSAGAALVNLPIREAKPALPAAAPA